MNKNTRFLANFDPPTSSRVIKGAMVPKDSDPCKQHSHIGVCLDLVERPTSKGRCVNSSEERKVSGRKPWRGHGNPLGRDGVTYEVATGSKRD